MTGVKLLLSAWAATVAFCLLHIVFGPGGLTETSALREQQARLEVRLTELRADNLRLSARYEGLRTSVEAVRLEARSLGWFQRGEVPVRTLDGARFHLPSPAPDQSGVTPLPSERTETSLFFRLAWPLLFLVFHLLQILAGRLRPPDTAAPPALVLPGGLDFFRK